MARRFKRTVTQVCRRGFWTASHMAAPQSLLRSTTIPFSPKTMEGLPSSYWIYAPRSNSHTLHHSRKPLYAVTGIFDSAPYGLAPAARCLAHAIRQPRAALRCYLPAQPANRAAGGMYYARKRPPHVNFFTTVRAIPLGLYPSTSQTPPFCPRLLRLCPVATPHLSLRSTPI